MIANPDGANQTLKVSFELPTGKWTVSRLLEGDVLAQMDKQSVSVYVGPYGSDTIVLSKLD
jgi:hypothetical protein